MNSKDVFLGHYGLADNLSDPLSLSIRILGRHKNEIIFLDIFFMSKIHFTVFFKSMFDQLIKCRSGSKIKKNVCCLQPGSGSENFMLILCVGSRYETIWKESYINLLRLCNLHYTNWNNNECL